MEQRSQWNFEAGEGGWLWKVAHPDGRTEASVEPFATLKQCVDDATQRGYVPWKAEDERRRNAGLTASPIRKASGE